MHILITGGTGFIGSALVPALTAAGHRVTVLTRTERSSASQVDFITDLAVLEAPVDAVINLAGASLADRRWSASYKETLRESRLGTTRALGEALARLGSAPEVFLSASAIGYYGSRGDEVLDESSAPGEGFAADLCRDWEAAAANACPEGTRLCTLRLGVVFDRDGGAYPQMALPFRLRFGNWVGSGHQWLSWIHRQDVVAAISMLLQRADASGAFNLTAPAAVTSRGFCAAMQAQHRSLLKLPIPAPVMRTLLGEMADELLIGGQHVVPRRLEAMGFGFTYPTLDAALDSLEA